MWKMAIIDDDPNVLRVMKKIIPWDEFGLEWVGEGRNGQQGLKLIQETRPDIVITDIYMPVLNGLDMIEQLRNEGYDGKFVILSGYSDFEYAQKSVRFGVDDYLLKPISVDMLSQVIEKVSHKLDEERKDKKKWSEYNQKLLTYEPFAITEWLTSIVNGTYSDNLYHDRFIQTRADYWLSGVFLTLAIDVEKKNRNVNSAITDWKQLRFAIGNIVHDVLLEQGVDAHVVPIPRCMGVVILRFEQYTAVTEIESQVNHLYDVIQRYLVKYLRIDVLIGCGTHVYDLQRIHHSVNEAISSLHAQDKSRDLEVQERHLKFYHSLNMAVSQFNLEQANELLLEFVVALHSTPFVKPAFLQKTAMEIWTLLEYSLYCTGTYTEDMYPKVKLEHDLTQISSVRHFELWLGSIIERMMTSDRSNENLKHKIVTDKVVDYIHQHYAEEITLEELADVVDISRNYLCFIFKNITGETYNQFLTRVRIEKAKEMIREGRWLVYEISEKVGYKNYPYFSTIFKKIAGCTPTEFAKITRIKTM